ncbi:reverse transcriptase family protein [Singulisphaera sp. Ch08]|uniref:Reverse transcriptase family protein n=1 Tax=Singulisphaera sp. Ch08 TaxID=3120278 RepID=A0AAU7C7E0_9BACT
MGRPPLLSTQNTEFIVRGLAEAFAEGVWDLDGLVARGEQTLGRRPRWLRPLARRLLAAFPPGPRPRAARIARFIHTDRGFARVRERSELTMEWSRRPPPVMSPGPGAPGSWPVPAIVTPEDLAARVGLTRSELDWFADSQGREGREASEKVRHYQYRWQAKRSGSARLIEAPKPRLKSLQRWLLDEILAVIPPHDAAHGFHIGRSVRTYIEPHIGRTIVLKMDLRDFFPSISAAWITSLFLTAGYPEPVARLLSGLCTNCVPPDVWADPRCPIQGPEHWRLRRLHRQPHLPQAPRPPPHWRTSAPSGSTAVCRRLPARSKPDTPDTPTTWPSRGATGSRERSIGSRSRSARLPWKKASRSSPGRRERCVKPSASAWPASSSTCGRTSPGQSMTG